MSSTARGGLTQVWVVLVATAPPALARRAEIMSNRLDPMVGRRDVIRALTGAAVAAAMIAAPPEPAAADTEDNSAKRKARYQASSPEVQTFYRVNRYPTK
jgi:hypothetical protein